MKRKLRKRKLARKTVRKSKFETTLKEDVGKFLLDFGKLVFAGIVFGSVMRYQIPIDILLTGAIALATVSCIVGLILGVRKVKADKPETIANKLVARKSARRKRRKG